jgi:hypothetical protein
MKTRLYFVCLLMCFALVAQVLAAMDELTKPGLGFPDSFPASARAKLEAVLQRPDCKFVGGMAHNAGTNLRYAGETRSLNLFLESLAECPGITLSMRFHSYTYLGEADWALEQDGFDPTHLCVRVNLKSPRIHFEDLVVPVIKGPRLSETK